MLDGYLIEQFEVQIYFVSKKIGVKKVRDPKYLGAAMNFVRKILGQQSSVVKNKLGSKRKKKKKYRKHGIQILVLERFWF